MSSRTILGPLQTQPLTATAGTLDDAVVAGDKVDGALFAAADSGGFATIQLSRPSATGSA